LYCSSSVQEHEREASSIEHLELELVPQPELKH
jgi:hypothetical protein